MQVYNYMFYYSLKMGSSSYENKHLSVIMRVFTLNSLLYLTLMEILEIYDFLITYTYLITMEFIYLFILKANLKKFSWNGKNQIRMK